MFASAPELLIGWTTATTADEARALATGLVEAGLAACVQIDSPITSVYRWQERTETAPEYRLSIKFLPVHRAAVEAWIRDHHPYDTPEWVVVRAEHVSENYLSWARANSSSPHL